MENQSPVKPRRRGADSVKTKRRTYLSEKEVSLDDNSPVTLISMTLFCHQFPWLIIDLQTHHEQTPNLAHDFGSGFEQVFAEFWSALFDPFQIQFKHPYSVPYLKAPLRCTLSSVVQLETNELELFSIVYPRNLRYGH